MPYAAPTTWKAKGPRTWSRHTAKELAGAVAGVSGSAEAAERITPDARVAEVEAKRVGAVGRRSEGALRLERRSRGQGQLGRSIGQQGKEGEEPYRVVKLVLADAPIRVLLAELDQPLVQDLPGVEGGDQTKNSSNRGSRAQLTKGDMIRACQTPGRPSTLTARRSLEQQSQLVVSVPSDRRGLTEQEGDERPFERSRDQRGGAGQAREDGLEPVEQCRRDEASDDGHGRKGSGGRRSSEESRGGRSGEKPEGSSPESKRERSPRFGRLLNGDAVSARASCWLQAILTE